MQIYDSSIDSVYIWPAISNNIDVSAIKDSYVLIYSLYLLHIYSLHKEFLAVCCCFAVTDRIRKTSVE